jgi:hypothetical protein
MNWLAKINLTIVAQRLGSFRTAVLLLVVLGLCLYSGYRFGNFYHSYQQQQIQVKERQLVSLYQQEEQYLRQIHYLEVELEVEKLANQRSLNTLKTMEADHYRVKKELAFYEKVMAPEKQADGVVIDSLTITPSESSHHYRFQVVLVQKDKKKRYAKGFIEFTLVGSSAEKPKSYSISDLSTVNKSELAFNFRYFQTIDGEFTLPEQFIPEKIELAAVLPKGKWQKYSRLDERYRWQDLIKPEQVSLSAHELN